MYYQEIRPGVFMSNDNKIHYKLDRCPWCGCENVLTHHKYTNMCVDCGNTYNMYSVRRNRRIKGSLTMKTARSHLLLLEKLLERRSLGLRLPDTFDEELDATRELVAGMEGLLRLSLSEEPATCSYCGAETRVAKGHKGTVRCDACQKTYNRYRQLCRCVDTLDERGCDELCAIIRAYIGSEHASPRVSSVIPRLQRRIASLGGNRQIFYYTEEID